MSSSPSRSQDDRAFEAANLIRERANWEALARNVADVTFVARQQGLLDSPWTVYLFDSHRGPYLTVDPSGEWTLGEWGGIVYAAAQQPGICRASNAIVARTRFALIEALER